MRYHSTRGDVKGLTFKDVLLSGYASDGGMLLPETYPQISKETLKSWAGLSYEELAYNVTSLFVTDEDIPTEEFKGYSFFSFVSQIFLSFNYYQSHQKNIFLGNT